MEIVEQLQVFAFRNPGDLVLCPEPFPLVQPPAAFTGVARLANMDGVIGNVRAPLGIMGRYSRLSANLYPLVDYVNMKGGYIQ